MFGRRKEIIRVVLTANEMHILKRALVEWRNYLIERDYPTDDVDQILIRLYK